MNELMIVLKSGGWMYFKTEEKTADKALTKFEETCENVGINIDNLEIKLVKLRSEENVDIDELKIF